MKADKKQRATGSQGTGHRQQIQQPRRESIIEKLGGKWNCIAMTAFAILAIGGGMIGMIIEGNQQRAAQWERSWPITTNQHIEWTWAGKPNP